MKEDFHTKLKIKMHNFVMFTYDITENFPKSELYGSTSQIRRASLSIMLNYIEGFARFRPKVKLQFIEISHGSIKECKYLIFLALKRNWINTEQYNQAFSILNEIGAMIYSIIQGLKKQTTS